MNQRGNLRTSAGPLVTGRDPRSVAHQERVGQVCVTCAALIFSDFNIGSFNFWSIWLVISFVLMLLYEINWIQYFKGEHTLKRFYGSFCGFPVAGASLPITAFLLLSIYGKVIWLSLSVIMLGIGHIGIHLQHLKAIKKYD